jgi:hypothetical protein
MSQFRISAPIPEENGAIDEMTAKYIKLRESADRAKNT